MRKIDVSEYVSLVKEDCVLVDFTASWCGPCKMLKPILEELEKEIDMTFVYVDVDEQIDLCESLKIRSVPTVHIYKNGKLVKMFQGYYPKEMLQSLLKKIVE